MQLWVPSAMNSFNFSRLLSGAAKSVRHSVKTVKSTTSSTNTFDAATSLLPTAQKVNAVGNTSNSLIRHVWYKFISQQSSYANSLAAKLRARACQQFLCRNATKIPLLAFTGYYLADEEKEEPEVSIGKLAEYVSSNIDQFVKCQEDPRVFPMQFSGYNIGERLGSPSSNAAVYSADYDGCEVALKIMFNYSAPSNETAISEAFEREYKVLPTSQRNESCEQIRISRRFMNEKEDKVMPEHPYIIKLHGKFVDKMPLLPDAIKSYPVAVPRALHCGGHGRNKTLCLVMPRYACSLREYLASNILTHEQSLSIFHQLLEGVAHLEQNMIAHRDLKSDNILIDIRDDGSIQIAITDFGCCLVEQDMLLPYSTRYTDRGGNFALLAPEIATAIPQEGFYLDYSKADAWTCGTLAYEIFGGINPFYDGLCNAEYTDQDIAEIPLNSDSKLIDAITVSLLQTDPERRITASNAASMVSLLLHAPSEWLLFPRLIHQESVEVWLLGLALTTLNKCRCYGDTRFLPPNLLTDLVFLRRVTFPDVMDALNLISGLQK